MSDKYFTCNSFVIFSFEQLYNNGNPYLEPAGAEGTLADGDDDVDGCSDATDRTLMDATL